jgi:hypothetical protein
MDPPIERPIRLVPSDLGRHNSPQTSDLAPGKSVTLERKSWTHYLLSAAKLIVFAMLCWFIYHTFVSGNETLSAHTWHVEPQWLVLSAALYLLAMLPAAVFWQRVLVHAGQKVGFGDALRAYYISQLGKYVPGKWMVIVLRRGMLHSPDAENTVVAASVFFETLTMLAVGAAISALMLVLWYPEQRLLIAAALGSTLLLGVPTVPAVFGWLIRVLGVGKLNPTVRSKLTRIGPRAILIGWITIALGWFLLGMSFWATLRAMDATTGGPFHELALHTTAMSLGMVAGFISQIPGGLGAREWVSAELMQPEYGASVAIVSAIIFRLVLLVSELVISIILYAVGWRRGRKSAAAIEAEPSASDNC